jgi:hypothetical protein
MSMRVFVSSMTSISISTSGPSTRRSAQSAAIELATGIRAIEYQSHRARLKRR